MIKNLLVRGFVLSTVVFIITLVAGGLSPVQQEKVFFGNLHSHTSYSDGLGTPREAYLRARDVAKLDFLALTEHNHDQALGDDHFGIGNNAALYKGPGAQSLISIANSMTQNGKFIAMYGQEYSTISSGNHTNVFDIGELITVEKGRFDKLLDFLAINKDSTGQTPVLMFNHPDNTPDIEPKEYGRDDFSSQAEFVAKMGAQARLIQIINGPGQTAGDNQKPATPDEVAFLKYLSLGFKLAPTADQDNHQKNWGTATPARSAIIATELTKASLLDAMRNRHVYATQDKNLKVIVRVNGHLCGDVVPPPPASELSITYSISDADEPNAEYTFQVFRGAVGGPPAVLVNSVTLPTGNSEGSIQDVAFSGEPQYFFFKVVQFNESGGQDRVWTAPIWFEGAAPTPTPTPDAGSQFVASKRSNTYHVSLDCLDAQRIKPDNLIRGEQAKQGRQLHEGCPRITGGR